MFSRKSITERQPINLGSFLSEVVKMLRHTIPEHIRIDVDISVQGCWVSADPTQIQQLVTNLAVNARDAMPDGGELAISARRERITPAVAGPVFSAQWMSRCGVHSAYSRCALGMCSVTVV